MPTKQVVRLNQLEDRLRIRVDASSVKHPVDPLTILQPSSSLAGGEPAEPAQRNLPRPAFGRPPQTDEEGRLPLYVKLVYGMPRFTIRASYIVISIYANLFYINLGAKLSKMAFFIAAGRSLDVVTDPFMGWWSDSCTSGYGRRKPFLLPGLVLYNVLYILFFSPPKDLSPDALTNWFGLFYILFFVADTFTSVPYYALGVELTDSYMERNSVYFWQNLFAGVGTLFGMVTPGALLFVLSQETTVFTITASSFGVVHALGMLLILLLVKERSAFVSDDSQAKSQEPLTHETHDAVSRELEALHEDERKANNANAIVKKNVQIGGSVSGKGKVEGGGEGEDEDEASTHASPFVVNIRRVLLNPAFRPLLWSWLFDWGSLGLLTAAFPFYIQYVIIRPDGVDPSSADTAVTYLAICSGALFISSICAMPFWLWLGSKLGKRPAWLIYNVANSITCPWFFVLGEGDIVGAALISALNGFAVGGQFFVDSVTADVVDYDEFLHGSRIEASFVTLATFVPKIVLVFSTAIPLSLIAAAGFRSSIGMQCSELHALGYDQADECDPLRCTLEHTDACPKAPQPQPELVITIMRVLFCAGPAILTAIGCCIKLFFPIRKVEQMVEVQQGIKLHAQGLAARDPICPRSHGTVRVWAGLLGRPPTASEQRHIWRLEHFSAATVRALAACVPVSATADLGILAPPQGTGAKSAAAGRARGAGVRTLLCTTAGHAWVSLLVFSGSLVTAVATFPLLDDNKWAWVPSLTCVLAGSMLTYVFYSAARYKTARQLVADPPPLELMQQHLLRFTPGVGSGAGSGTVFSGAGVAPADSEPEERAPSAAAGGGAGQGNAPGAGSCR